MPQAKTEVALQLSECCAAEVALQDSLFCSADVILTKSCAAASEKLQCHIEKAALQESGAFLPLSCAFQAPTFRHPRLGLAEPCANAYHRATSVRSSLCPLEDRCSHFKLINFQSASVSATTQICSNDPFCCCAHEQSECCQLRL